ncbi:hypothetical protein DNTS_004282, partial [Danionella cerebrum]
IFLQVDKMHMGDIKERYNSENVDFVLETAGTGSLQGSTDRPQLKARLSRKHRDEPHLYFPSQRLSEQNSVLRETAEEQRRPCTSLTKT